MSSCAAAISSVGTLMRAAYSPTSCETDARNASSTVSREAKALK